MSWSTRLKGWFSPNPRLEHLYGLNRRNVDLVYAENERRHYPLADNKWLCKQHLQRHGVPVPETVAVCQGLFDVEGALARLEERGNFVVKPSNGSGGEGILVVGDKCENGWKASKGRTLSRDELRTHLANLVFGAHSKTLEDIALIEERVVPHKLFSDLWNDGVCDLRIITLRCEPLMAMLRVPTSRSGGRANLHQGGIGIAVDLETGLTTHARSKDGALERHPETDEPLLERKMPHFEETVAVALRAARSVPLGYLGVDLVIDETRGPLVLEINARPGLEIQNINGLCMGEAMTAKGSR